MHALVPRLAARRIPACYNHRLETAAEPPIISHLKKLDGHPASHASKVAGPKLDGGRTALMHG